jgi:hypothetical protein
MRCELQFNGHPHAFIDSVTNSKGSSYPEKGERPLGSVYIPYVKGISEKLENI